MDLLEEHLAATRGVLASRLLVARKRYAQHFLLEPQRLRKIVAEAGPLAGRDVLEIGPGPGSLTAALLEAGARVTALELDASWASFTRAALARPAASRGGLDLREADALATAVATVAELTLRAGQPPVVVSNLPYAIASRLLVDLVQADPAPALLVVMVQAEVAARIVAPPGGRERGLLTLLIGLCARARRRFAVPAGAFTPRPEVESAVITIEPDAARAAALRARPRLVPLLKLAFQARRKMLRRMLVDAFGAAVLGKVPSALLDRRPEELADADWLTLVDALPDAS